MFDQSFNSLDHHKKNVMNNKKKTPHILMKTTKLELRNGTYWAKK